MKKNNGTLPFHHIVLTPSFNQRSFLFQTIVSVIRQTTCKDWLWYRILDGGSTDGTQKLLKLLPKSKTLIWSSGKDGGQSAALNTGLVESNILKAASSQAAQTIVSYINSDDYYLPGAFAHVDHIFATHPEVQWVVGDCVIIDANDNQIQKAIRLYKTIWRMLPLSWVLPVLNPVPQPAVFIRGTAVQKVGLFTSSLRYCFDYEYWFRLLKSVGLPYVTSQPLAAFRIHATSKGGSQFERQFAEEYQVASQFAGSPWLWIHAIHNKIILFWYQKRTHA